MMLQPILSSEQPSTSDLEHCPSNFHDRNEEIPAKVAAGEADVMITEITEAPWYVQNDPRLAAPLLDQPFTRGEIGVLMRKEQPDLLEFINKKIRRMKADGSLQSLHAKYGLVCGY